MVDDSVLDAKNVILASDDTVLTMLIVLEASTTTTASALVVNVLAIVALALSKSNDPTTVRVAVTVRSEDHTLVGDAVSVCVTAVLNDALANDICCPAVLCVKLDVSVALPSTITTALADSVPELTNMVAPPLTANPCMSMVSELAIVDEPTMIGFADADCVMFEASVAVANCTILVSSTNSPGPHTNEGVVFHVPADDHVSSNWLNLSVADARSKSSALADTLMVLSSVATAVACILLAVADCVMVDASVADARSRSCADALTLTVVAKVAVALLIFRALADTENVEVSVALTSDT